MPRSYRHISEYEKEIIERFNKGQSSRKIAEELGFVGCILVFVLFAVFIWRGVLIAMKAPDMFGSLLAIGVTTLVATQAIINIAVVTASIPTTGMALPFFSYRRNCTVSTTGWSWNFA